MMTYGSFIAIHEAVQVGAGLWHRSEMLQSSQHTNGVITPSMAGFIARPRRKSRKQGEAMLQALSVRMGRWARRTWQPALAGAKKHHIILARSKKNRRADCRRVS